MKTVSDRIFKVPMLRIFNKKKILKWPKMVRWALRISNSTDFKLTNNIHIVRLNKPHPLYFSSNPFPFEGHCVM